MTCKACETANADPVSGLYHAGCQECSARRLSRSIEHTRARAIGKMTPEYMAVLRECFGDGWEAGHQRVKAWARKDLG